MAADDSGPLGTKVVAEQVPRNDHFVLTGLARGRVSDRYVAEATRVSHGSPRHQARHASPCPRCGSDDVVDVTQEGDDVAMGLCANGHVTAVKAPTD